MRNLTITVAVLIGLVVSFASCGEKKKESASEPEKMEVHKHGEDVVMAAYQCPMKCEEEKTYSEPGSCPICKMDLKKVEEPAEKSEAVTEE